MQYGYKAPPTGDFYEAFTRSWGANPDTLDPNGGTAQGGACRQAQPLPCIKP